MTFIFEKALLRLLNTNETALAEAFDRLEKLGKEDGVHGCGLGRDHIALWVYTEEQKVALTNKLAGENVTIVIEVRPISEGQPGTD